MQEYSLKVNRPIENEPATTAYPALVVSLGSGVSIIKVNRNRRRSESILYNRSLSRLDVTMMVKL